VIVILAVVTALVVPSLFNATASDSAADESRRLQQALRLAVDEAQLTAVPLRWWARRHRYGFEQWEGQQWQPADDSALRDRTLDAGVVIDRVLENGVDQQPEEEDAAAASTPLTQKQFARERPPQDPLIGRALILPNGMVSMVDVVLLAEGGKHQKQHRLQLRPGPAGIAEQQENDKGER